MLQSGGDDPSNWVSKTGKDHIFDVGKYAYFAREFALNTFIRKRFRFGMAPSILRRFEKAIKKENEEHQQEAKKSSYWNLR